MRPSCSTCGRCWARWLGRFASLLRAGRGRMPQFTSTDRELASMLAYLRTLKQ